LSLDAVLTLAQMVKHAGAASEASAFDNAQEPAKWKKPLRDNELTDSIEVKS
jgi:hypothetical protein